MVQLMSTAIRGLLAARVEYPFGGTAVKTTAFFVPRPNQAHVWIYSTSHAQDYKKQIEELGGVNYQLLNHRDEASKFSNVLDAPVFCHELERDAISKKGCQVSETFSGKEHRFGDDLVAYHTPGHTVGATSYLWRPDDQTSVLFPGDSLYVNESQDLARGPLNFHAYDGNIQDMIESFQFILELNPTYTVSGLSQGEGFILEFRRERLQQLILELEAML